MGTARFIGAVLIVAGMMLSILVVIQSIFSPFHVVASGSMAPNIKTGDAVYIKNIEPSDIAVGKIIIFRDPTDKTSLVIHRVVALEKMGSATVYRTKGDSNPVNDDWTVSNGAIVGTPGFVSSGFGYFINRITSFGGFMATAAIPAMVGFLLIMLLGIEESSEKRAAASAVPVFQISPVGTAIASGPTVEPKTFAPLPPLCKH